MAKLSNTEKLFRELAKLTDQTNVRYNKRLVKSYKKALAQTRDEIVQLYAKFGNTPTFQQAANRLANLEKNLASAIIDLTGETVETIRDGTLSTYNLNFKGTNNIFGTEFGIVNRRAVAASVVNPMRWERATNRYSSQLLSGVRNIVTNALLTGEKLDKTLKKVTDKFDIDANRAMRILRTEIHRNENAAKLQSIESNFAEAKKLGLNMRKVWVSVIDGRTRDSHIEMNLKEADKNGIFTFPSGGTTLAPGNSGIAEEDINCRCSVILDFAKEKE